MKALICGGPGKIDCESVPDPVLMDDRAAIIKTTSCGICGSDLHPYHVDLGRPAYCIGHEAVGEVVEVGRAVKRFCGGRPSPAGRVLGLRTMRALPPR